MGEECLNLNLPLIARLGDSVKTIAELAKSFSQSNSLLKAALGIAFTFAAKCDQLANKSELSGFLEDKLRSFERKIG
jgi:hypothetical protein